MTLVGDIGGTNTTLALVRQDGCRFALEKTARYGSSVLGSMGQALGAFLDQPGVDRSDIDVCCLSGAGPVRNNVCSMTNVAWKIDGNQIQADLGIRTHVINDFSAICYALPLIDTHPQISTVTIPHPDGSTPAGHGPVRAVVGAGTGLGTGYLIEDGGHYTAHPSEGGHSAFAPADQEMLALQEYLDRRFEVRAGAEQYISGQGIRNIYRCFRETNRIRTDAVTRRIDAAPVHDVPELVARGADDHDGLASVMRLFVRMYGMYASNTALYLLPSGGLYLAGGIAAKNEQWLLKDNLFMSTFEQNYNARIRPLLRSTPVVLIKDYSCSLYGAAHAAVSLA